MKILLDTSLLVAAMIEGHPAHERALPWLQRVKDKTHDGCIAAHSIAELYAILTTLPVQPRISPDVARHFIQQNVLDLCTIVSLSEKDYVAVIEHLSNLGLLGGVTYDALILYAGIKAGVERVVTLNEEHFRRVYPHFAEKISST